MKKINWDSWTCLGSNVKKREHTFPCPVSLLTDMLQPGDRLSVAQPANTMVAIQMLSNLSSKYSQKKEERLPSQLFSGAQRCCTEPRDLAWREYAMEYPDAEGIKLKKMEKMTGFVDFLASFFPGIGMHK